jgi:TusA-related sulfurtransferase
MAEHRVDVKGKACPQPIMETSRAVKAAAPGDIIIIEATDIGFYNDIKAWCQKTGNELVSLEKRITIYVAKIKKQEILK